MPKIHKFTNSLTHITGGRQVLVPDGARLLERIHAFTLSIGRMATPEDRQRLLREQGFCLCRPGLSEALLEELRAVVELSTEHGVSSISDAHRWNDRYQGDHLFIGFSDADMEREGATRHDAYARLIAAPEVLSALRTCTGLAPTQPAPRYWAGSVMSKPPGGPPLYWHHDWAFWDHEVSLRPTAPQLFVMVYLTATTPANGELLHRGTPTLSLCSSAPSDA
jgi:hypothetical protein